MRPARRILSITLSALGILTLGLLVSVAANSVPGRGAEEPLLDAAWRPDVDVTAVATWLVLIAAVMGAIIMALSVRETRPPREHKRRGVMVLLLGVLVFAVIARYMGSVAGTLLPETSEVVGQVGEQPIAESSRNSAWLLSLLVAGIIAVALTRVGLSIRSAAPPFQDLAETVDPSPLGPALSVAPPQLADSSPRGRILGAYRDFEQKIGEAGVLRGEAETAARHAGRARAALGLDQEDLSLLSGRHADARFGPDEPSVEAAREAELASSRLRKGIRQ